MEKKILIIEDLKNMRTVLRLNLSRQGYTVLEATDGEEGLDIAEDKLPDLILTDLMMPYMDGFTFIKLLKQNERLKHIPIIVLSAKGAKDDVIKAVSLGAKDYIAKPFELKSLLEKIETLIGVSEIEK